jgi:hypothetical protein
MSRPLGEETVAAFTDDLRAKKREIEKAYLQNDFHFDNSP